MVHGVDFGKHIESVKVGFKFELCQLGPDNSSQAKCLGLTRKKGPPKVKYEKKRPQKVKMKLKGATKHELKGKIL